MFINFLPGLKINKESIIDKCSKDFWVNFHHYINSFYNPNQHYKDWHETFIFQNFIFSWFSFMMHISLCMLSYPLHFLNWSFQKCVEWTLRHYWDGLWWWLQDKICADNQRQVKIKWDILSKVHHQNKYHLENLWNIWQFLLIFRFCLYEFYSWKFFKLGE